MNFNNSLTIALLSILFSSINSMDNKATPMTPINDWQDAKQFDELIVAYIFTHQAINYGYVDRGKYFCLEKDYPKGYRLAPLLKEGEPLDTFVLKNEFIIEHKPGLRLINQYEREEIKKKLHSGSHEFAFIDKSVVLKLLENK